LVTTADRRRRRRCDPGVDVFFVRVFFRITCVFLYLVYGIKRPASRVSRLALIFFLDLPRSSIDGRDALCLVCGCVHIGGTL